MSHLETMRSVYRSWQIHSNSAKLLCKNIINKNTSQIRIIFILVAGFALICSISHWFSELCLPERSRLSSCIECEREKKHSFLGLFAVGVEICGWGIWQLLGTQLLCSKVSTAIPLESQKFKEARAPVTICKDEITTSLPLLITFCCKTIPKYYHLFMPIIPYFRRKNSLLQFFIDCFFFENP